MNKPTVGQLLPIRTADRQPGEGRQPLDYPPPKCVKKGTFTLVLRTATTIMVLPLSAWNRSAADAKVESTEIEVAKSKSATAMAS